jgi:hypothetical protein
MGRRSLPTFSYGVVDISIAASAVIHRPFFGVFGFWMRKKF